MELGSFSVSLNVRDIEASRDFYAKLGFEPVGGNEKDNWLILRNGRHVIGLFQGLFEKNILTFNPGWDQQGNEVESFTDVREIQEKLKGLGVSIVSEALGGLHSAPIAMFSVDFQEIETLQHAGDWDATARILASKAAQVEAAGAESLLICTNTMHIVASEISAADVRWSGIR